MPLVDDPNETITCDPSSCADCGADLAAAPVSGMSRRQVTDVVAPPPPRVTEYRILTRVCACCAARQSGPAPAFAPSRAQYGPRVLARAAERTCGHYLPVACATALMALMLGGGLDRVHRRSPPPGCPAIGGELPAPGPRTAAPGGVLHVDETPSSSLTR